MPFRPRKLRHRVDIERQVESRDSNGDRVTVWETVHADVPAEIVGVSVREFIASKATQNQTVAYITIRSKPGLDGSMRIVHGDRIYNPEGWLPDPDSMQMYLTAPCSQGVNEG